MTDILPKKNEEYGTKEYWDQRYAQESEDSSFDWFKSYNDIADIIRDTLLDPLPPPSRLDAHCPGPFFVRVLRHFPLPTPSDFPIEGQDVPG
ncbi:hypothetical protein C8Q70DRAFT_228115 [Cubamyces menziesii]|nr:hypothetical protein C8Q70DRAFT_228115 [Cubamyces menziesii]